MVVRNKITKTNEDIIQYSNWLDEEREINSKLKAKLRKCYQCFEEIKDLLMTDSCLNCPIYVDILNKISQAKEGE